MCRQQYTLTKHVQLSLKERVIIIPCIMLKTAQQNPRLHQKTHRKHLYVFKLSYLFQHPQHTIYTVKACKPKRIISLVFRQCYILMMSNYCPVQTSYSLTNVETAKRLLVHGICAGLGFYDRQKNLIQIMMAEKNSHFLLHFFKSLRIPQSQRQIDRQTDIVSKKQGGSKIRIIVLSSLITINAPH